MVLGMGDTGLDFGHCHFYDSSVPIPLTVGSGLSQESDGTPYFQSSAHRKVCQLKRGRHLRGPLLCVHTIATTTMCLCVPAGTCLLVHLPVSLRLVFKSSA